MAVTPINFSARCRWGTTAQPALLSPAGVCRVARRCDREVINKRPFSGIRTLLTEDKQAKVERLQAFIVHWKARDRLFNCITQSVAKVMVKCQSKPTRDRVA